MTGQKYYPHNGSRVRDRYLNGRRGTVLIAGDTSCKVLWDADTSWNRGRPFRMGIATSLLIPEDES